jgi:hypothetical protein
MGSLVSLCLSINDLKQPIIEFFPDIKKTPTTVKRTIILEMAEKKYGGWKASAIMRAICFFALGIQATIVAQEQEITIEALLFIGTYIFGIYIAGKRDATQLKIFAGVVVLLAAGRAFFNLGSTFSGSRKQNIGIQKTSNTRVVGNGNGKGVSNTIYWVGLDHVSLLDWIHFLMACALAFLALTL